MSQPLSPTERIIAEIDGAVGWLTFNNPARRNAMSLDMWEAVPTVLERFDSDPAVRVIALKGAGDKAFLSGADISEFEKQRASLDAREHYDRVAEAATRRLAACAKPTIAMIRGFCMGGGVGVAMSCDLRIASDDARFAIPAARLGVSYRWTGIKALVDLVGPANAKEIFFTARQFSADEAWQMGLVNRVLPADELDAFVQSYCTMIAENAPLTITAVKGIIAEVTKPDPEIDRGHCVGLVARCFDSADYVEGRRAFMEKRRPVFKGE